MATPFGRVGIRIRDKRLVAIDFVSARVPIQAPMDPVARRVCAELRAYLRSPGHQFRLPLGMVGTPFQRRVWRALQRIPSGSVVPYGTLAAHLATAPRAVGAACRANPVPIVVPCHRVVAKSGIGGFMGRQQGAAIERKARLIAHEARR